VGALHTITSQAAQRSARAILVAAPRMKRAKNPLENPQNLIGRDPRSDRNAARAAPRPAGRPYRLREACARCASALRSADGACARIVPCGRCDRLADARRASPQAIARGRSHVPPRPRADPKKFSKNFAPTR
jgi:hypothetical protein